MSRQSNISKIIENMINLNKNNSHEPIVVGNNIPALTLLLKKIDDDNLESLGSGCFKNCYRDGDKAVLYEKSNVGTPEKIIQEFNREKTIVDILILLGVQTPKYFDCACFKNDDAITTISTQEFIDGRVLYKFNNNINNNEEIENPHSEYNLATVKERVEFGPRHISQFLRDFNCLHPINMLIDGHGKNIMFNKKTGYYFIDHSFAGVPEIDCLEKMLEYIENPIITPFLRNINNKSYLGPNVSYKDQARFLFCFSTLNPLSFSNISDNFAFFVYNGMLAEQFNSHVEKDISLPESFSVGDPPPKYVFGMHKFDLVSLYEILKTNNQEKIEMFKDIFGLSKSFDIHAELDSPFFIEQMEKTILPNMKNCFDINSP